MSKDLSILLLKPPPEVICWALCLAAVFCHYRFNIKPTCRTQRRLGKSLTEFIKMFDTKDMNWIWNRSGVGFTEVCRDDSLISWAGR